MTLFQAVYDAGPHGHWVFLLCTIILGCSGAYVTGKAIAETWRPYWHVLAYTLALTLVVRFIHFALFEEVMVSLRNFLVDAAFLIAAGLVGHAVARRRQMATQYGWSSNR